MSISVEKLKQYGVGSYKPPEQKWLARVVLYDEKRNVLGLDFAPKCTMSAEGTTAEMESAAVNIRVEYPGGKQPKIKHVMLEIRKDPISEENRWTEYETRLPMGKWVIEGSDSGTYSVTVPKNPLVEKPDPF
jgi:hypothetical protein